MLVMKIILSHRTTYDSHLLLLTKKFLLSSNEVFQLFTIWLQSIECILKHTVGNFNGLISIKASTTWHSGFVIKVRGFCFRSDDLQKGNEMKSVSDVTLLSQLWESSNLAPWLNSCTEETLSEKKIYQYTKQWVHDYI